MSVNEELMVTQHTELTCASLFRPIPMDCRSNSPAEEARSDEQAEAVRLR